MVVNQRRLWMMWWAGILAMAALVHVLRAMLGVAVMIGTIAVPMWTSWAIVLAAGLGSLALVRRARRAG